MIRNPRRRGASLVWRLFVATLTIALAAVSALASTGMGNAMDASKTVLCPWKHVEDFTGSAALLRLRQNAALDAIQIKSDSPLALPNQGTYGYALQATPVSQGPFSFGRHFPMSESWKGASGLTFWYYGHKTGKSVDVTVLSREAPDPGPAGWQLVWSDEFDGPAGSLPDPANWTYDLGDGSSNGNPGWGNHELEYYTKDPANVSTDGQGHLVITARQTIAGNAPSCYYGDCQYTSARIKTAGRVELGYGRIEARIKVPSGTGLWPAFWGLGTDIDTVGWPQSGEMDIMENVGRLPNRLFGTLHSPGDPSYAGVGGIYDAPAPLSDDFHTYAVQWEPAKISFSLDGTVYETITPSNLAPGGWVYKHPFFLLLNLAVGGDFGGPVDPGLKFPRSMIVDYVRAYGAPDTAARFTAHFKDSFTGWHRVSVPFKSFKRAAEQPAGAPPGGLSLSHISGYQFTVPEGIDRALIAEIRLARSNGKKHC